jgi:hypothetical protein
VSTALVSNTSLISSEIRKRKRALRCILIFSLEREIPDNQGKEFIIGFMEADKAGHGTLIISQSLLQAKGCKFTPTMYV